MIRQYPSKSVLSAFGITQPPQALNGGEGTSYLANGLVLKPVENNIEAVWNAQLMESVPETGFRLPKPVKTRSGDYVYKNWQAYTFLRGHEIKGRWPEKISVCKIFHQSLKSYPKPSFIDHSDHPWGIADRMIWNEQPLICSSYVANFLKPLQNLIKPINLPSQLIHGDMTGNILFEDNLPPAIIDFSPYWRPAEYATAIILVDSIVWEKAPDSILSLISPNQYSNQLLIRACMWRILTTELYIGEYHRGNIKDIESYRPLIDLISYRFY